MDTEYESEDKAEVEEETQRSSIDYELPIAPGSTDEPVFEEKASDSIDLPYWKPDESDNVLTRAIYRQLIQCYVQENPTWDPQMRSDMLGESKTLDYSIMIGTGTISGHILHKWIKRKVTWPRFWTLRVMFGPAACARQSWFPETLKRFPDFALKSAYTGVVPPNFQDVLELDEWVPPLPTLEECRYDRIKVAKRTAASIGVLWCRRLKRRANSVSATTDTTAAAATVLPTTFTLQRSLNTNNTEELVDPPPTMRQQFMNPHDFVTNETPPPHNRDERGIFRPFQEKQSSQVNHHDTQELFMELSDENIYLRQINAIQQRLIEQYQEKILRLESKAAE
jgi:hypothetical protein